MLDVEPIKGILRALGTPYSWGAGSLLNARTAGPEGVPGVGGGVGWDCSGFAQWALLQLGIVRPDAWTDLAASDLAYACDPVERVALLRVGDLCFYRNNVGRINHVMVYIGGGMCLGASGGGRQTNADDPTACVQVRPILYRPNPLFGTLKEQYRLT